MSFEKNLHYEANETDRRGSQSVIFGKVMEVDTAKARMRVQAGKLQSAWVPFASSRAGPDSSWHPPEPGEQVILACPGGDTNQAVCLGSVYQQDYPAPADSADVSKTKWKDGAEQSYDRAGHNWNLTVPDGGSITLNMGASSIVVGAEEIALTAPTIRLKGAVVFDGGQAGSAAGQALKIASDVSITLESPSITDDTPNHTTTGVHTDSNGKHNDGMAINALGRRMLSETRRTLAAEEAIAALGSELVKTSVFNSLYVPFSLVGQIEFDFDPSLYDFDIATQEGRQQFFDTLESQGVSYTSSLGTDRATGSITNYDPDTAPAWLKPREVNTGEADNDAWLSYDDYVATYGRQIPPTYQWGGETWPSSLLGTWATADEVNIALAEAIGAS